MSPRTAFLAAAVAALIAGALLLATLGRRPAHPPGGGGGVPYSSWDSLGNVLLESQRTERGLRQRIQDLERMARPDLIDTTDVLRLQDRGFAAPVESLKADLERHGELIPFPGVLGGTMFFEEAHVLNDRWVFASFEDGHIDGSMLLEYRVRDGHIRWRRVAAYLDEGGPP